MAKRAAARTTNAGAKKRLTPRASVAGRVPPRRHSPSKTHRSPRSPSACAKRAVWSPEPTAIRSAPARWRSRCCRSPRSRRRRFSATLADARSPVGGDASSRAARFSTPSSPWRIRRAPVLDPERSPPPGGGELLGLHSIVALVSSDPHLAFRILALNTEKAHNLRDRSLEVIRMARALARERRGAKESDYAAEFESPALLTLGILYEGNRRFSGGAYLPLLRKVDRFAAAALGASLRAREGHAARIADIDRRVGAIVERLKARGFRSPYLRAYVVARVNPVRWMRQKTAAAKPPMPLGEALTRMGRAFATSTSLPSSRAIWRCWPRSRRPKPSEARGPLPRSPRGDPGVTPSGLAFPRPARRPRASARRARRSGASRARQTSPVHRAGGGLAPRDHRAVARSTRGRASRARPAPADRAPRPPLRPARSS